MNTFFRLCVWGILLISLLLSCETDRRGQQNEQPTDNQAVNTGVDSSLDSVTGQGQATVPPSTSSPGTREIASRPSNVFPYDLSKYENRFKLPGDLQEISGLSYYKDKKLATIQDEKGKIFIFDYIMGEVTAEYKFEKREDYEGIELIGETAYILRSDGKIYEVINFSDDKPKVNEFKTALRTKNDTEGLGYSPEENALLIACKSAPSLKGEDPLDGHRAIYSFSLDSYELNPTPILLLHQDSLLLHLDEGALTAFAKEIIATVDDDITFRPSGIAIHPMSGHYYIIGNIGKLLLVINTEGELLHVINLKKLKGFKHPEGICFAPDGTLFISNEGDEGRGNILQFNYITP